MKVLINKKLYSKEEPEEVYIDTEKIVAVQKINPDKEDYFKIYLDHFIIDVHYSSYNNLMRVWK